MKYSCASPKVDLIAFDEAIDAGDATGLETAVALYRGPLLEGCHEEWVFPERAARPEFVVPVAVESVAI